MADVIEDKSAKVGNTHEVAEPRSDDAPAGGPARGIGASGGDSVALIIRDTSPSTSGGDGVGGGPPLPEK